MCLRSEKCLSKAYETFAIVILPFQDFYQLYSCLGHRQMLRSLQSKTQRCKILLQMIVKQIERCLKYL